MCFVMCVVCGGRLAVVQVALMGVVSSAVAAMDAHRGVAAVAEHGLGFLRYLSMVDANMVCVFGGGALLVDKEDGLSRGVVREWYVWHGW